MLAGRYVEKFEHKWVKGRGLLSHELLGNVEIQSLADLGIAMLLLARCALSHSGSGT